VLEAGLTQDSCENSSEDYKFTQVLQCVAKPLWHHYTISSDQRCVGVPLLFCPEKDSLDRAVIGVKPDVYCTLILPPFAGAASWGDSTVQPFQMEPPAGIPAADPVSVERKPPK
jgi:hypothetical protein